MPQRIYKEPLEFIKCKESLKYPLSKWTCKLDKHPSKDFSGRPKWPALKYEVSPPSCALIGQALVNDIHTIQPSVNGINEVGVYLKKEAEPPFAVYIQKLLDELNSQWENVCKQVCDLHVDAALSRCHVSRA